MRLCCYVCEGAECIHLFVGMMIHKNDETSMDQYFIYRNNCWVNLGVQFYISKKQMR
jgi:hypothetical protein